MLSDSPPCAKTNIAICQSDIFQPWGQGAGPKDTLPILPSLPIFLNLAILAMTYFMVALGFIPLIGFLDNPLSLDIVGFRWTCWLKLVRLNLALVSEPGKLKLAYAHECSAENNGLSDCFLLFGNCESVISQKC